MIIDLHSLKLKGWLFKFIDNRIVDKEDEASRQFFFIYRFVHWSQETDRSVSPRKFDVQIISRRRRWHLAAATDPLFCEAKILLRWDEFHNKHKV